MTFLGWVPEVVLLAVEGPFELVVSYTSSIALWLSFIRGLGNHIGQACSLVVFTYTLNVDLPPFAFTDTSLQP